MVTKMFGEFLKELRQKRGYTLREYCRTFEKDPGYLSKIERGKTAPPIKESELTSLALSLGLKENTEEWNDFFTKAVLSSGRIPKEIMSDENLLGLFPTLLRIVSGRKFSNDKLEELIDVIKSNPAWQNYL